MSRFLIFLCWLALGAPLLAQTPRPICLVSNGFHSALAIRLKDLPPKVRALSADPTADSLLIGWGAAAFFTAQKNGPILFLRTLSLPNPSALHLLAFRGSPAKRFPHSDIFEFHTTSAQLAQIGLFIENSLAWDSRGQARRLSSEKCSQGHFFAGTEWFWFPSNCNVWSARILRRAGLPFGRARSMAASELVHQAERMGRRIQRKQLPVDAF